MAQRVEKGLVLQRVDLPIGGIEATPPQILHLRSETDNRQDPVKRDEEAITAGLEDTRVHFVVPALEVVMAFRSEHVFIGFHDSGHFQSACGDGSKARRVRLDDEAEVEDIDGSRA